MDYKYIEQLLERYFRAETTLSEENILKAFFEQPATDMPEALKRWVPLFTTLGEKETLGEDFDERLLAIVEGDDRAAAQHEAKVLPLNTVKARTISLTERLRPLFGAAATVAILLSFAMAISQSLAGSSAWVDTNDYAALPTIQQEATVAYDQMADSLNRAQEVPPQTTVAATDSIKAVTPDID